MRPTLSLQAMIPTISESDLKNLVSSSARKQNFLAGHHPAAHGIAFTALAVSGLAARTLGKPTIEESLLGPDLTTFQLPDMTKTGVEPQPVSPSTIMYSCRTCSRPSRNNLAVIGPLCTGLSLESVLANGSGAAGWQRRRAWCGAERVGRTNLNLEGPKTSMG